jgi:hypothetical protein
MVTEITILDIYDFITITAGGLLVPEAMIRQGVSVLILAWLIKYLNVNIDHTRHKTQYKDKQANIKIKHRKLRR